VHPFGVRHCRQRVVPAADGRYGDPSVLLRLYLRYGLLDAAATFAISYIQSVRLGRPRARSTPATERGPRGGASPLPPQETKRIPSNSKHAGLSWLPYTALEQLLAQLNHASDGARDAFPHVQDALSRYFEWAHRATERLVELD
jgi:hypothetical protein